MTVVFERGDIFATDGIASFAHGCNCAGAMGKGVAVLFRERWPAMYDEYRRSCLIGEFQLGDVFVWEEQGDTIFNLGTQPSWRSKAQLDAVEGSLTLMIREAEARHVEAIAMPRVGAGLGVLDWPAVRRVIEALGEQAHIQLRVCDEYVAGQPLCLTE